MSAAQKLNFDDLTGEIYQLDTTDHIRLRLEMYAGSRDPHTQMVLSLIEEDSLFVNFNTTRKGVTLREETWIPALRTCFREITDNSNDELSHGFGNRIDVTFDETTFEFSVRDNGRGIPLDQALMALTSPMTGRNFGNRSNVVGTNGFGAAVVSNTSKEFHFEISRDNKILRQTIFEGETGFGGKLEILPPTTTPTNNRKTGTFIRFIPSYNVFKKRILSTNFIKTRLLESAVCNPQWKFYFNGEYLNVKPEIGDTLFPNHKYIKFEINDVDTRFRSRFWLALNFVESGDHYHSIVNSIFTPDGGTHIDTFKKLFPGVLLKALEPISKRRRLTPNRGDITEKLLVFNITDMHSPDFDSQSKTRLINEYVTNIITKFLDNDEFSKQFIRDNKEWIDEIYQRCSDRTQKKDASDITKLGRKLLRNKVPGLMDAASSKRQNCILFLAEGESAVSGMASVRDPDLHGGLGLRGKIMNVNGESPKKVFDNKCLTEIMNSVGLVIGQRANRQNLRYGKIYLATDSDEDGKNIAALLVNFFYSFWPELFSPDLDPFIYIFQTPFVIAEKGKQRKYFYAHNYNEFKPEEWNGWAITRAKGLGTLMEEDWAYSLRTPVAFPLIDDGNIKDTLSLIFDSKKADLRKQWIGL